MKHQAVVYRCGFCGIQEVKEPHGRITRMDYDDLLFSQPHGWRLVDETPWCGTCDPREKRK